MKWAFWFVPACMAGIAAVLVVIWLAGGFQGTALDANITVALVLGILFISLLGVGLMGLIFYSNRSGQDDEVYRSAEDGRSAGSEEPDSRNGPPP
ncbi:MAG TPA: hypothetical protein VGJ31_08155 [Dongiaceae bacterium]|jgi:hypothetical protein